jgi:predicted neuraminidase
MMKRKSNNNGGGKRRNNKKRSKKSNVLVFILSITIFYRVVVVQRGVGRSFMTKHSRKEQLQSQFEYDPFAKDVDSYGVNVEDVDAPLAPESQTSSTSDASVLAALANASSSSYVPKQTKERAFYGERRDVFGHASWQPVQARLVDYAGATISVEGKFARRSFARAFAANNNNNTNNNNNNNNNNGDNDNSNNELASDLGVRGPRLKRPTHKAWISPIANNTLKYKHMATIARLGSVDSPNARFVVAWQGAEDNEGSLTQRIYHAFSKSSTGEKWGPEFKIPAIENGNAQWSPVLHVDEDNNEIFLFYSESRECIRIAPQEGDFNPSGVQNDRQLPGGDIMMTSLKVPTFENYEWLKSVRWAPPKKIFRQGDVGKGVGPIPKVIANPMIVLRSGVWLLPYWREPHDAPPCSNLLLTKGNAGVLRSRDNGKTWKAYGKLDHPRTWLIENTLSERDDGSVLMLFRTKIGVLYASASYDEGITWTPPESTAIPNPDSKIVLTRLHSGALAMVLNAHGKLKGQKRHARTFLDVAVSGDGGATWRRIARLEDESQSPLVRSHYPTAIEAFREGGTRLLITYSKFYFGLGGLDQAIQEQRPMGIRLQSISLK